MNLDPIKICNGSSLTLKWFLEKIEVNDSRIESVIGVIINHLKKRSNKVMIRSEMGHAGS
jgi:hypothetical protein